MKRLFDNVISVFVVVIVLFLLIPLPPFLLDVFLIINMDEVVKLPAAIIHYQKYGWLKNITR